MPKYSNIIYHPCNQSTTNARRTMVAKHRAEKDIGKMPSRRKVKKEKERCRSSEHPSCVTIHRVVDTLKDEIIKKSLIQPMNCVAQSTSSPTIIGTTNDTMVSQWPGWCQCCEYKHWEVRRKWEERDPEHGATNRWQAGDGSRRVRNVLNLAVQVDLLEGLNLCGFEDLARFASHEAKAVFFLFEQMLAIVVADELSRIAI